MAEVGGPFLTGVDGRRTGRCAGRAESLAARWAAKEAVLKALGTGVDASAMTDVEVVDGPAGPPWCCAARGGPRRRAGAPDVGGVAVPRRRARAGVRGRHGLTRRGPAPDPGLTAPPVTLPDMPRGPPPAPLSSRDPAGSRRGADRLCHRRRGRRTRRRQGPAGPQHRLPLVRAGFEVGGLWQIDNDNGGAAAYHSLHLNSSRPRTEYPTTRCLRTGRTTRRTTRWRSTSRTSPTTSACAN